MVEGGNGNGSRSAPAPWNSKELQSRFVDKADLTNLSFVGMRLRGLSARHAFFSGTLFRDCTLEGCDFSRSDFDGVAFENCTFAACNLSIADFRSVEFARSRFIDCGFEEGSIKNSIFLDCILERCRMFQQSFEENRLTRCRLIDCNFHRSTMIHDEFEEAHLIRTDLADCTSIYHIFSNCEFADSLLNAEAVGLTFGLTRDNLDGLGLSWLGDKLPMHEGGADLLIQDLITTYEERGWRFAAGILRLNFGVLPPLEAFGEIFRAIESAAAAPLPLKADELRFLARVVGTLSDEGRLPLFAVITGLDILAHAAELRDGRDEFAFRPLHHILKEAEQTAFGEFDRCWDTLGRLPPEQPVRIRFVLRERPDLDLAKWLAELHELRGIGGPPPRFVEAYAGSYVEVFWMLPISLASLVVALGMVVRIVDHLIQIRARVEILRGEKLPPAIRTKALQPLPAHGALIAKEIRDYIGVFTGRGGQRLASGAQEFGEKLERIEVLDQFDSSDRNR